MTPEEQLARLEKRLLREKAARQAAEQLLEDKSLALYTANTELSALAQSLEAKVSERTEALADALQQAQAGERAKSQFLGLMSHELRTPMNGILGMAELLAATPLNRDQQELLSTLQESAHHLLGMISDLLDLTALDNHQLVLVNEVYDPNSILGEAVAECQRLARPKGLAVDLDAPSPLPTLRGDALRLRQILFNLVSNAAKFTQNGRIVLGTRYLPLDDGRVRLVISVRDTGCGMAPAQKDRLFQTFDTHHRPQGGTGMGLTISQRLAKAMQGRIDVESVEGMGSCFTLTWHSEQVGRSAKPLPDSQMLPEPMHDLRILLAIDNPLQQRLMQAILARLGIRQLHITADPVSTLDEIGRGQTDLLLLDHALASVATQIRHLPAAQQPDIVLLSGDPDGLPLLDPPELVDDYLTLPLQPELLASTLYQCAMGRYSRLRQQ